MSVNPSDLSDQARSARRANNDMFDSLGDLGDTIEREEDLIDDLERGIEEPREVLYDVLEQVETDYRRVEAFADEMHSRQEEQNNHLEDILDDYQQGSNSTSWQTQPGWGMYQQQGFMRQQQGIGWNSWNDNFWSTAYQGQSQDNYGQSQQQSHSQSWQNEFFGNSEDNNILNGEDEEPDDDPVDIVDGTEDEDYTDSGDEDDSYDEPDGSVNMSDNWNPDASFDYEAEQSTETVNQSFSFSGSGFEPSGSITMEQSAGGETQYFEASF